MVTATRLDQVASVDGFGDRSVLRNAFHGFVFGLTSPRSVFYCPITVYVDVLEEG